MGFCAARPRESDTTGFGMGGHSTKRAERSQIGSFYGPFFRIYSHLELDAIGSVG
jgi:hypothetical protein